MIANVEYQVPPAHVSRHRRTLSANDIHRLQNPMPASEIVDTSEPKPIDFSTKRDSGHHSEDSRGTPIGNSEEFNGPSDPKRPRNDLPLHISAIDPYCVPYSNLPSPAQFPQSVGDHCFMGRSVVPSMPDAYASYQPPSVSNVILLPHGFQASYVETQERPLKRSYQDALSNLQITRPTPLRPAAKKTEATRLFKNVDQLLRDRETQLYVAMSESSVNGSNLGAGCGLSPVSVREVIGEFGERASDPAVRGSSSSQHADVDPQVVPENESSQDTRMSVGTGDVVVSQKTAKAGGGGGRRKGTPVPDDKKDEAYRIRRAKNNEAAKKSRDNRKKKEDVLTYTASQLKNTCSTLTCEKEILAREVAKRDEEIRRLRDIDIQKDYYINYLHTVLKTCTSPS